MTLRYTQIADETVGREYFEALSRIAERYQLLRSSSESASPERNPVELLEDAIRWVTKNLYVESIEGKAKLLIRRLQAARDVLEQLRAALAPRP